MPAAAGTKRSDYVTSTRTDTLRVPVNSAIITGAVEGTFFIILLFFILLLVSCGPAGDTAGVYKSPQVAS